MSDRVYYTFAIESLAGQNCIYIRSYVGVTFHDAHFWYLMKAFRAFEQDRLGFKRLISLGQHPTIIRDGKNLVIGRNGRFGNAPMSCSVADLIEGTENCIIFLNHKNLLGFKDCESKTLSRVVHDYPLLFGVPLNRIIIDGGDVSHEIKL